MSWAYNILPFVSVLAVLSGGIAAFSAIYIRGRSAKQEADLLRALEANATARNNLRQMVANLDAAKNSLDATNGLVAQSHLDRLKETDQQLRDGLAEMDRNAENLKALVASIDTKELRNVR